MSRIIVWFRNDLRLHDNELLQKCIDKGAEILPVFCFDIRQFQNNFLGFPKTDSFRTRFLIESVRDLKTNLQKIGGNLLVCVGNPENIIPDLALKYKIKSVLISAEVTQEEINTENIIEQKLLENKIELNKFWQSTLYHIQDLSYPIKNLPDVFTQFRKGAEALVKVRKTFVSPTKISLIPAIENWGNIPSEQDLGIFPIQTNQKQALNFKGGETAGKDRLADYLWNTNHISNYKETRNELLGENYSSKFSAWLALGCLSPRYIYEEIIKYEKEKIKNDSTYWLIFELIWRDYFRFVAKKYGNKIFQLEGIKPKPNLKWNENKIWFEQWKNGNTGIPFIDANMRELNQTGFMSNRGRQNVASFLTKDLKINWTWGAAYFESKLIDYDVCSNWGNWIYIAGVGNDPREDRYFNILVQGKRYDEKGKYIKYWLPELEKVNDKFIHLLQLDMFQQKEFGVNIGKNYPNPMINPMKWER
ncbi:MAG: DASH family cryptochrome [Bacteroidetes bacterium]|nr:MAG: DASH family cryptochrome [Bacteroidota bacterium]TAG92479.1 MAG: DASH family cryptochrome [Bacteroidota bacterium]